MSKPSFLLIYEEDTLIAGLKQLQITMHEQLLDHNNFTTPGTLELKTLIKREKTIYLQISIQRELEFSQNISGSFNTCIVCASHKLRNFESSRYVYNRSILVT
jgi:hypothetical protein